MKLKLSFAIFFLADTFRCCLFFANISTNQTVLSWQVAEIASRCEADALRIAAEKAACEADLAKAQPFVDEAETAISSIKPAHIGTWCVSFKVCHGSE